MLRRVEIEDEHLDLAERALGGLAHRYRQDAERTQNPLIRAGFEEHAMRREQIANDIARSRAWGTQQTHIARKWAYAQHNPHALLTHSLHRIRHQANSVLRLA